MSTENRIFMLKTLSALLLIIPGVVMVLAPVSPLSILVEGFLDIARLPIDDGEKIDSGSASLLNAILGGILIGFGAMIALVATDVLRSDLVLGRRLIIIPLSVWFISESTGSILAGAPFNAVINIAILAGFAAALFCPARKIDTAP